MEKEKLIDIVDNLQSIIIDASDKIWEYGEIYFQEEKSANLLANICKEHGFSVEMGVSGMPTAFVAKWGTGSTTIGFLAEYDALEGVAQAKGVFEKQLPNTENTVSGHGCGHNALGAGSLGAALALKEYATKNNLDISVQYFGCPGEENGSGKVFMARDGLFNECDICLTWHPGDENNIIGVGSLANLSVKFEFTGLTSHAAAHPHLGRSALDAAELMNVGVNYLREHMIPEARIHYSYLDAGTKAPNVVQDYACTYYFIRAPKANQMFDLAKRVYKVAQGAAMMTETDVKISIMDGLSDYIPNLTLGNLMAECFKELGPVNYTKEDIEMAKNYSKYFGEEQIYSAKKALAAAYNKTPDLYDDIYLDNLVPQYKHTPDKALPGSTDVGDTSYCVPTAQCNVTCMAIGTPGHSWQLTGQLSSPLAHKGTVHAAKVMALTALRAVLNPEIIQKAKAEHKINVPNGYICPTPDDVNPDIPK